VYSYVRNLLLPFLRPAVFRTKVGSTDTCLPRHPVFRNFILGTDLVKLSCKKLVIFNSVSVKSHDKFRLQFCRLQGCPAVQVNG
jgi:hypothetical protein